MNWKSDPTGKQFGKWTVLKIDENNKYWICQCSCGVTRPVIKYNLTKGGSQSCGCYKAGIRHSYHGMTNTDEHNIWLGIKERCYSKSAKEYNRYGGRGIRMSQRWLDSFVNFYEDMGNRPSKLHSIDRINNDGNYEPSNCKWATRSEQQRNTRRTLLVTYRGITVSAAEMAEKFGVNYKLFHSRLRYGWTVEMSLFGKPKHQRQS